MQKNDQSSNGRPRFKILSRKNESEIILPRLTMAKCIMCLKNKSVNEFKEKKIGRLRRKCKTCIDQLISEFNKNQKIKYTNYKKFDSDRAVLTEHNNIGCIVQKCMICLKQKSINKFSKVQMSWKQCQRKCIECVNKTLSEFNKNQNNLLVNKNTVEKKKNKNYDFDKSVQVKNDFKLKKNGGLNINHDVPPKIKITEKQGENQDLTIPISDEKNVKLSKNCELIISQDVSVNNYLKKGTRNRNLTNVTSQQKNVNQKHYFAQKFCEGQDVRNIFEHHQKQEILELKTKLLFYEEEFKPQMDGIFFEQCVKIDEKDVMIEKQKFELEIALSKNIYFEQTMMGLPSSQTEALFYEQHEQIDEKNKIIETLNFELEKAISKYIYYEETMQNQMEDLKIKNHEKLNFELENVISKDIFFEETMRSQMENLEVKNDEQRNQIKKLEKKNHEQHQKIQEQGQIIEEQSIKLRQLVAEKLENPNKIQQLEQKIKRQEAQYRDLLNLEKSKKYRL